MSNEYSDSESEDDDEWDIRAKLNTGSCSSMFATPPYKFIPEGLVDELVSPEVVRRAFKIGEPSDKEQLLIDFVLERARRVFAVAVWAKVDVKRAMGWFKHNDIDDLKLPIKVQTSEWKSRWRSEFYDEQWRFFAAVFVTTSFSHDFDEARVLPFTSMSSVSDEGAFGEVYKVTVHQNHMRPVSVCCTLADLS
jgi:hypothetical protein